MENLQVNQIKQQPKPVMETKKREWKRTTFNFFNGKAWCYKKLEQLPHREQGDLWPMGYYCANPTCKNELVFRWKDARYRDSEPFRFHKLLVKVLEKKDDDWRTGRKTHTYYAFCCACAKKDKSDGTVKQNKFTKKLMSFEMEKCDCADFIEDKKREATQAIANYNSMISDCSDLIRELQQLAFKENISSDSFKGRRINDFLSQLTKRQDSDRESRSTQQDYLTLYNEWETKRNQQLEALKGKIKYEG